MKRPIRILLVEDSDDDALLLQRQLERGGFDPRVVRVSRPEEFEQALDQDIEAIICDFNLPGFNAPGALRRVKELGIDVPFLVVSGSVPEDVAVKMMRDGAHDYIMKDNLTRLPASLDRELADAQSRRAQKVSEDHLRLLFESVRDYAIIMLDERGRVLDWNPGAERIKGYSRDEINGRHFELFYPEEERKAGVPRRHLERALSEGRTEYEGWRVRKDGSHFWANVVLTAMYDDAGKLRGFAKVTRDITEKKRAQDELIRSNQELQQFTWL